MANNEEKALKDRLSNLEKKYKESVFTKPKVLDIAKNFEKNSLQEDDDSLPKIEKEISQPVLREKSLVPEVNDFSEINVKGKEFEKSRERMFEKSRGKEFEKSRERMFEKSRERMFEKPIKNEIRKPVRKPMFSKPLFKSGVKKEELEIKQVFEEKVVKPNEEEIESALSNIDKIRKEMGKAVIGQEEIVDGLIMGLLCDAHVIVEGVPGIAKTLAIKTLAKVSGCDVKRVQFTVDMLPTDIIGITSYTPQKGFEVIKGPIFTNFLIADEINRSPPKTQSALIEGMQEKQVTIGKESFVLPNPFFVMATINPIENAGVYPLPEAQIDRFLFKLKMGYPKKEEEKIIMSSNITLKKFEDFNLKSVVTPKKILNMQEIVKKIYMDDNVKSYILDIVTKTRDKDFEGAEYITYGSSPRASIGIFIASKARALMKGRNYVLPEDVKGVVFSVLRHRLILSYKTTIQKISADSIIQKILDSVRVS